MIVPSIDLQDGQTVQLIGGRERELTAGDPRPLATRFGRVGEIAVIDLDAAIGTGRQTELIRELLDLAPCRVGGGIRDYETARMWLDAGARKIILGTAATPELLAQLPKDRVIVALDADAGEVVVEGWRTRTGTTIEARLAELRPYADAFLITFVEHEGRMGGIDLDRVTSLVGHAAGAHLTLAGGVTTAAEIAALDAMGVDAQIGMALYKGVLDLTAGFAAPLRSDRADGLWPTVVQDADGALLGLCYSSAASLQDAIESGRGVYESRTRGRWVKGESSGDVQELLSVAVDCDRDTLCFTVRQGGDGFCHEKRWSCFEGRVAQRLDLGGLGRHLTARRDGEASYTKRLLGDPELLAAKLVEEAGELAAAEGRTRVMEEAADVIYFTAVAMVRAGVAASDVWTELDRRSRKVTRRKGDAKTGGDA